MNLYEIMRIIMQSMTEAAHTLAVDFTHLAKRSQIVDGDVACEFFTVRSADGIIRTYRVQVECIHIE